MSPEKPDIPMDLSVKTRRKLRLEEFLRQNLDHAPAGRVIQWVRREDGIFRILWTHQSSGAFTHDDAALFRYWAIARGKPSNLSSVELKQSLRMALNKSPSVERVPATQDEYRYFRFTDWGSERHSDPGSSKDGFRSPRKSGSYMKSRSPMPPFLHSQAEVESTSPRYPYDERYALHSSHPENRHSCSLSSSASSASSSYSSSSSSYSSSPPNIHDSYPWQSTIDDPGENHDTFPLSEDVDMSPYDALPLHYQQSLAAMRERLVAETTLPSQMKFPPSSVLSSSLGVNGDLPMDYTTFGLPEAPVPLAPKHDRIPKNGNGSLLNTTYSDFSVSRVPMTLTVQHDQTLVDENGTLFSPHYNDFSPISSDPGLLLNEASSTSQLGTFTADLLTSAKSYELMKRLRMKHSAK